MTMTPTDMVLVAVSLIAMFSPPATIGSAASILAYAPREAIKRVAWLVARNYAIVMIVAIAIGHEILSLLGIATSALTVTGGAALLHQGWPLMTRGSKAEQPDPTEAQTLPTNWESLAAVPLTFPITIGGGTIAVAVATSGRYPTLPDTAVLIGISLLVAAIVGITFLLVAPIEVRLGAAAMDIVTRGSGIILVALGAQLFVHGLIDLVELKLGAFGAWHFNGAGGAR